MELITGKKENEIKEIIYIKQSELKPWFGRIDGNDMIIISYIVNWEKTEGAEKTFSKKGNFIWIDYAYLLKQLPGLNIGYSALKKRLSRLCEIGVLDRRVTYREKTGKRATYYRFLGVKDKDDSGENGQSETESPPEIKSLRSVE